MHITRFLKILTAAERNSNWYINMVRLREINIIYHVWWRHGHTSYVEIIRNFDVKTTLIIRCVDDVEIIDVVSTLKQWLYFYLSSVDVESKSNRRLVVDGRNFDNIPTSKQRGVSTTLKHMKYKVKLIFWTAVCSIKTCKKLFHINTLFQLFSTKLVQKLAQKVRQEMF